MMMVTLESVEWKRVIIAAKEIAEGQPKFFSCSAPLLLVWIRLPMFRTEYLILTLQMKLNLRGALDNRPF